MYRNNSDFTFNSRSSQNTNRSFHGDRQPEQDSYEMTRYKSIINPNNDDPRNNTTSLQRFDPNLYESNNYALNTMDYRNDHLQDELYEVQNKSESDSSDSDSDSDNEESYGQKYDKKTRSKIQKEIEWRYSDLDK